MTTNINPEIVRAMLEMRVAEENPQTMLEILTIHAKFTAMSFIESTNQELSREAREDLVTKMFEMTQRMGAAVYVCLSRFRAFQKCDLTEDGYSLTIPQDVVNDYTLALLEEVENLLNAGQITHDGKFVYVGS